MKKKQEKWEYFVFIEVPKILLVLTAFFNLRTENPHENFLPKYTANNRPIKNLSINKIMLQIFQKCSYLHSIRYLKMTPYIILTMWGLWVLSTNCLECLAYSLQGLEMHFARVVVFHVSIHSGCKRHYWHVIF